MRNTRSRFPVTPFARAVLTAVRRIPRGRVASYGAVAGIAGRPGAARAVGAALRSLPDSTEVPWWRVLNARGELTIPRAGHGRPLQRALLEAEGVVVKGDRVDLRRFGWPPDAARAADPG